MKFETKILLFYLGLDQKEQNRFKSVLGFEQFEKLLSSSEVNKLNSHIKNIYHSHKRLSTDEFDEDYDIAIMKLVRHIVNTSDSNQDLARAIEKITGEFVSRSEKRSNYELQGILLAALMKAPKERFLQIKNELLSKSYNSKRGDTPSSLEKWFSIILRDND